MRVFSCLYKETDWINDKLHWLSPLLIGTGTGRCWTGWEEDFFPVSLSMYTP